MGRRTVDDLAGELYRARNQSPPKPPTWLSPGAKSTWREIADRGSGWFRPGSTQLLSQFCEMEEQFHKLSAFLSTVEVGTSVYGRV
jgi:phage terminase small subunit